MWSHYSPVPHVESWWTWLNFSGEHRDGTWHFHPAGFKTFWILLLNIRKHLESFSSWSTQNVNVFYLAPEGSKRCTRFSFCCCKSQRPKCQQLFLLIPPPAHTVTTLLVIHATHVSHHTEVPVIPCDLILIKSGVFRLRTIKICSSQICISEIFRQLIFKSWHVQMQFTSRIIFSSDFIAERRTYVS